MTDTSTNIAARPPRIEEGYALPTPERRSGFLGTARAMAGPAVEAARESLAASRGGVGDYFLNMPMAALNLADAGFRGGVGAFADLVPGLSAAQRRDLAREVAAVPEAFAASVGRVPEAVDEGVGALSEVARRMFQEGPVPETLYSGIDPGEFLRAMRGRRDAAELQRRREDMIAGGIPEAEVDRRLGRVPRPADPDALLSEFASAREAAFGASRDMSFEELMALSGRQAEARDAAVAALSGEPSVRLFNRNDRAVVVGPGMGPGEEGRFRVTYFDADREPTNHTVFETKEEALSEALRGGFDSRTAAPSPEDFGFYQDNPALTRSSGVEWLENKQRIADETYAERRGITGSTTATLGSGKIDMFLPTDFMRRIPGLLDERRVPGEVQYERLMQDVRERGFLPDQDRNRIVLGINHRGEPFIIEGNTRTAVASDLGIPNVRVEVRYMNGGEMVDGPFAPRNVSRIAARGPEGFAQGGEVMMRGIGSLNGVARGMFRA